MSNNKQSSVALLGAMAMMSAQSSYTNAYEGLTDVSSAKSKLTKKQMKSRAKSKAARKARKR